MSITLEIIEGPDYSRDESGWEHNAYTVHLRRGSRSMSTPWMQGLGIAGNPDAASVLESLMLDASGYATAQDFSDWCAEYGLDADSRESEQTYRQVETLTRKLRRFLGDDWDETSTEDAEEAAKRLVSA